MAGQTLTFKIRGVAPLLMHNGQLADPLNRYTKAMKQLTSKRNKTEADLIELSKIEWHGGLYLMNQHPCIPGEVVEAGLVEAAKKQKMGRQTELGLACNDTFELHFEGEDLPIEQLWEKEEYRLYKRAGLRGSSVMRTRPMFNNWWAEITVEYDDETLNEKSVVDSMTMMGKMGIMDWRPRYGRFVIEKWHNGTE